MDFFEIMLQQKLAGEGSDVKVNSLSVTENGTYTALPGHAFSPVNVSVPVGVFPSGTSSITANGIYDITNFASVDVNVSGGGGDTSVEDGIIDKSISGAYENSRVTSIGTNAFYSCTSLTTASFPNVTSIGTSAFGYCSRLTTINFPNVTSIGSYAFYSCTSLTTASFPNVTSIGTYAFYNCTSLTIANFSNVPSIGTSAFGYCSRLTTISFPNVTSIGTNAFGYCSSLTTASFPNVTSIGSSAFYNCSKLTTAIFLASSVATLKNASVFYNTPMRGSTYTGSFGSIYVPASLVDSYKTATNWSVYADRITAYEGE